MRYLTEYSISKKVPSAQPYCQNGFAENSLLVTVGWSAGRPGPRWEWPTLSGVSSRAVWQRIYRRGNQLRWVGGSRRVYANWTELRSLLACAVSIKLSNASRRRVVHAAEATDGWLTPPIIVRFSTKYTTVLVTDRTYQYKVTNIYAPHRKRNSRWICNL